MQMLLSGNRKKGIWGRIADGLKTIVTLPLPHVYSSQTNKEIADRREEIQKAQLKLQYLQHQEREFNLEQRDRENREFQADQADLNRKLQYLQHQEREANLEQRDRENRGFQEKMAALSHERQKELSEFRAEVDRAIQEKNLAFQRWSLERQKALQLEMKSLEADLARELRQYDRETSLKVIEEQKKLNNSPIWLVSGQILNADTEPPSLPLHVFFAPPSLPYDRSGPSAGKTAFPEMADYLAESLRQLFGVYTAGERKVDFLYGAWTSNFFHGEAAARSLFDALKAEPCLILESSVEGDYFNLRFGFWGPGWPEYRYGTFISGLSWREALNDFAKARAQRWKERRDQWIGAGKPAEAFDQRYGAETVKRFTANLAIWEREAACLAEGDALEEIERPYALHKSDYEQLRRFIGICHCMAAGIFADEYFLAHVPVEHRRPPLLPGLLPEFIEGIPAGERDDLISGVVSACERLYEHIGESESAWLPELFLDLARSLCGLPDQTWARTQLFRSLGEWLRLRHLPLPRQADGTDPSPLNIAARLKIMETELCLADLDYAGKLNAFLADLGIDHRPDIADSCFRRGVRRYEEKAFAEAVSDFDQAIHLRPDWDEAWYHRGKARAGLEEFEAAIEDYSRVIERKDRHPSDIPEKALNSRADAHYRLGAHQQAIADYEQALELRPDWPEARQNLEIVRGVFSEIRRRKAAEEEQRRREEAERERIEQQYGREFEYEFVRADRKGRIKKRIPAKSYQQIEDLGDGVTLEMVYIPGGTFQMGSPADEEGRDDDEGPRHKRTISPFFMGKYPITQKQYKAVTGKNPSDFKGADRPVERVSWEDAIAFCRRLSERTGRKYSLPSEAQWEYACRAGTETPFHFGRTLTTELANYDGNRTYGNGPKGEYREETTPVGSFPPNPFGLYDMHGNVWEWCADPWHESYEKAPKDGRVWEKGGNDSRRLLRGGSWNNDPEYCRCANRIWDDSDYRLHDNGFRVVVVSAAWTRI